MSLLETLNEILLGKVSYETDIPERTLMNSQKFREYWQEFCETTEDTWSLQCVVEYTLELGYNGEFGDNVWED